MAIKVRITTIDENGIEKVQEVSVQELSNVDLAGNSKVEFITETGEQVNFSRDGSDLIATVSGADGSTQDISLKNFAVLMGSSSGGEGLSLSIVSSDGAQLSIISSVNDIPTFSPPAGNDDNASDGNDQNPPDQNNQNSNQPPPPPSNNGPASGNYSGDMEGGPNDPLGDPLNGSGPTDPTDPTDPLDANALPPPPTSPPPSDTGGGSGSIIFINSPPTVGADTFTGVEDTTIRISFDELLRNDADNDADPFNITSVNAIRGGDVVMDATGITFTPTPNFSGAALFSYTISDPFGGNTTGNVSLNMAPVADIPVATSGPQVVYENAGLYQLKQLAENDGITDFATRKSVSFNFNGKTVTVSTDSTSFSADHADADNTTTDSIWTVDVDGTVVSKEITAFVPGDVSSLLGVSAIFDITKHVVDPDLGYEGDVITLLSVDGASALGHTITQNGNLVSINIGSGYENLARGQVTTDTISYTVQDSTGTQSTATLNINITGTNDNPVVQVDTAGTTENATLVIDPLANDSDVDATDNLIISDAFAPDASGVVTIAADGKTITFDPGTDFDNLALNATRDVEVHYTVSDGNGGIVESDITLTVTGTNDAPVATADTLLSRENDIVDIDVLMNDTDVDATTGFTIVSASVGGGLGAATITTIQITDKDGNPVNHQIVRYDPGTNFDHLQEGQTGDAVITYVMQDEQGAQSTTTATVSMVGSNDAPVAVADVATTASNASVSIDVGANDTDAEGETTFVTTTASISSATPGAFAADFAGISSASATIVANNVVFNPGTDFDFLLSVLGDSMTVDIGYTVEDSKGGEASGTATVTVTGVNDAPVLVADTANTSEGVALNINVLANDKDPDRIDTMTVTSATISSATSVNGVVDTSTASVTIVNNMLQFDPGTAFDHLVVGQTDNAIIDYVVTDSEDNTSTTTTTITVAGTNTGSPRAFHDLDMAQEGGVTVGNVFSGADSDSVTNFHSKLGGDNQSTDGGHLLRSVNHGNVTYTLSADGQSVSASNASAVTFNAGTGNLVINSRLGGTLTITMTGASVGAYSYLAPSTIDFSAQQVITPGSGNDPIWLTVDEVDGNSNGLLDGADSLTYDFGDNLVLSTDVNYSGFSAGTDQGSVTLGRYDQATTAVEGGTSTTATKTLTATAGTADDGSRTADLNFASDNQSIWGADAPTEYSIPKTFYGDTWNASSDFSAITGERYWVPGFSYPYPYSHKHYYYGVPYWDVHWGTGWSPGFWIDTRTGLEGGVTTSGKVGVDLEFTANGGAVDSSFGFDTTYQIPTLDQQMAGGYVSLTPNAALQADYAVTHNMPFVSFDVDLVMQANLSAWMKGYILGSTVVDTSFAFGVNETIDLVSLAPVDPAASGYNDYGVKVTEPDFRYDLIGLGGNGIESQIAANLNVLGLDLSMPATFALGLPSTGFLRNTLGSVTFDFTAGDPTVTTEATGVISSSTRKDVVLFQQDVDGLISSALTSGLTSGLFSGKMVLTGGSALKSPWISYNFGDIKFGPGFDFIIGSDLTPTLLADVYFSAPVLVDGYASAVTELYDVDWNNLPGFKPVDDQGVDVTPVFKANAAYDSTVSLGIDGQLDMSAFNFAAGASFLTLAGFGPLTELSVKTPSLEIPLVQNTYNLDGYDSIAGQSFVLFAAPTVNGVTGYDAITFGADAGDYYIQDMTVNLDPNFIGTELFNYVLEDADGSASAATLSIQNQQAPIMMSVANANEDVALGSNLATLSIRNYAGATTDITYALTNNHGGLFSIAGDQLVLSAGSAGFDFESISSYALDFTATNSVTGDSYVSATSLAINDVNEAPTTVADTGTTTQGTPVTVTNVLANDSDADAGDSITLTSVSVAAGLGGTATISGSDILFDPGVSFDSLGNGVTGDATLSYVVTDSGGLISTGTATVTVTGTNDAPTSAGNTMTVTEDVAYVLSATDFAFSDIDTGDALASVRIDSLPGAGSLLLSGGAISATQVITIADINAGKLTYTPVANAYRAAYASFTYSVFDGLVYSAAAATMAIDVTAVNDLPTVDTNTGTSADEGVSVIITAAMLSSSDVESPAANITYSVTGAPAEGLVQLSGTTATSFTQADIDAGNVTYAHTNATLGAVADSITFSVTDADTGAVTGQTFSLTINATIDGTAGIDTLNGGNGNDTISGLAGNDVINGGAGVDTLTGGAGSDTLTGGAGSDTFAYLLADIIDLSTDVITDFEVQVSGAYVDTLDLSDVISNGYTTIAFANSGVDADTSGTLDDLTVSASNGTLTYDIATLTGMGGSTLLQDGTNTNLYYI